MLGNGAKKQEGKVQYSSDPEIDPVWNFDNFHETQGSTEADAVIMRINKRGRVLLPKQAAAISYMLQYHVDRELDMKLGVMKNDGPVDLYKGDASSYRHD